ncbi:MAG: ATP-binding cassette domain-containing protein [Bacteroidales bacterium]|nr:ATP-binding cassette domain-containing protein [Bacteroidales bacterium]
MDKKPIINFENAVIAQGDKTILCGVSFQIFEGEMVYLIGKTASGKSSLLKTIYCDLPLADGFASVADYDLASIRRKEIPYLRRELGIVFQDFQLLTDRTVYDNLLFTLKAIDWDDKEKMEQRILEVLQKVGLSESIHKMPHQLSGGEQQRVAIARALLNEPQILIADEPTGNLDPDASTAIMKILQEISQQGTAVFMATHNYNLIESFPGRVLCCLNGKMHEMFEETESSSNTTPFSETPYSETTELNA